MTVIFDYVILGLYWGWNLKDIIWELCSGLLNSRQNSKTRRVQVIGLSGSPALDPKPYLAFWFVTSKWIPRRLASSLFGVALRL